MKCIQKLKQKGLSATKSNRSSNYRDSDNVVALFRALKFIAKRLPLLFANALRA